MLKHLLLTGLLLSALASHGEELAPTKNQKNAYRISTGMLAQYHYNKLNYDKVSPEILQDYLEALDPWHVYFLESDINNFRQFENSLQNFKENDLSVPFLIYKVYQERAEALNQWSVERLAKPLSLDRQEKVDYPDLNDKNSRRPYFKTLDEVHDFQEKRLTDELIRLMFTGKSEERARKLLADRYKSAIKGLKQIESQDVFDIYMNAIALRFDPHTNYMSPRNSKDFDIGMSLSLQGIGAVLSNQDDEITIREIMKGSPAERSGKLKVKDKIIGVAQGKDGEMVDVVGWRLDKAVDLIRGKKGSTVRLKIETQDGDIREISLVRDEIKMEESAVSYTIEKVNGKKIGLVDIPSFYLDFDGARKGKGNYKSTSQDLEKVLKKLQSEKVDGVVIDLRGNGGGALEEAIKTVGLFIDQGPVVMANDGQESVVYNDEDGGKVAYDGPLAVLINDTSASASEIFAGAIQDYHRGLILGTNSFGKGTVQSVLDLARFNSSGEAIGSVRYTNATFHRVTGSSTQLKGVQPDVELPNDADLESVGEKSQKYALPWVEIDPAEYRSYKLTNGALIQQLNNQHQERVQKKDILQKYSQRMAFLKEELKNHRWSLNLDERKKEYQQKKDDKKAYEKAAREAVQAFKRDERIKKKLDEANLFIDEKSGEEKQDFVPDLELYESLNIFTDYLSAIK